MDYVCAFLGILFAIAGIFFAFGKIYKYIPAWKMMPEPEKEKIKIKPLCRNIGIIIMLNGILFILKGFCAGFTDQIFTGAIIVWFVIAGLDVYYISKSNRYLKQ